MSENQQINRRQFLIQSAFAGMGVALPVMLAHAQPLGILGANDRVRLGIIGLGQRGCKQIEILSGFPNVEIAAVCDSNSKLTAPVSSSIADTGGRRPIEFSEPRRVFDLKDVDAVCIAVPWKQRTEFAYQSLESGKDVFIDPPFGQTFAESQKLIDLSRKRKRIVALNENCEFRAPAGMINRNRVFEENFVSVSGRMNSGIENGAPRVFPETSYGSFDTARAIMEVGMPSAVRTLEVEGLSRRGVEFEFKSEAGENKNFIFEMDAEDGPLSNSADSFSRQSSYLRFMSARGAFEIYAVPSPRNFIDETRLSEFILSVKSRRVSQALEDLTEAKKSAAMLHLANLSAKFRRSIRFDPKAEKVIDDSEITKAF